MCKKFFKVVIIVVDLLLGMIELVKKKVMEDWVLFICGDIEELSIER